MCAVKKDVCVTTVGRRHNVCDDDGDGKSMAIIKWSTKIEPIIYPTRAADWFIQRFCFFLYHKSITARRYAFIFRSKTNKLELKDRFVELIMIEWGKRVYVCVCDTLIRIGLARAHSNTTTTNVYVEYAIHFSDVFQSKEEWCWVDVCSFQ